MSLYSDLLSLFEPNLSSVESNATALIDAYDRSVKRGSNIWGAKVITPQAAAAKQLLISEMTQIMETGGSVARYSRAISSAIGMYWRPAQLNMTPPPGATSVITNVVPTAPMPVINLSHSTDTQAVVQYLISSLVTHAGLVSGICTATVPGSPTPMAFPWIGYTLI